MFTEIVEIIVQALDQDVPIKHVDSHRALIKLRVVGQSEFSEEGRRDPQFIQEGRFLRLFFEPEDPPVRVAVHDPERRSCRAVEPRTVNDSGWYNNRQWARRSINAEITLACLRGHVSSSAGKRKGLELREDFLHFHPPGYFIL